jgi:PAS domain-containing protein
MESKKHAKVPGGDTQAWLAGLNRAILDSALDCIITMGASGHVVEFNPAAERVFASLERKRSAKNWRS